MSRLEAVHLRFVRTEAKVDFMSAATGVILVATCSCVYYCTALTGQKNDLFCVD